MWSWPTTTNTTERTGQRVYMAHLWFREDSAWNVSLNERGLVCDVKLDPQDPEAISRVLIPVGHVWRIQRVDTSTEDGEIKTYDWPERMHFRLPGQPELSE